MNIPRPIVTREHGSWAVMAVPMIVGAAITGRWTADVLLLGFSVLNIFMCYIPAQIIFRRYAGDTHNGQKLTQAKFWLLVHLSLGLIAALPLLLHGLWMLIMIGLLGVLSFLGNFFLTRRFQKTIAGDFIATAGLTLGAPAAYYVGTHSFDNNMLIVWIFNLLFFGGTVFYVHMKIKAASIKKPSISAKEKLSLGWMALSYHLFSIAVVSILVATHLTPFLTLVAFVPITIHALYGTAVLSNSVSFKKLGLILLGQAIGFGSVLIIFAR